MGPKQALAEHFRSLKIDSRIIAAFDKVPREVFVPKSLQHLAYIDEPLPTLRNQTISQPTTVMIMLQALNITKGNHVLEIGSGMGYQSALSSHLVGEFGNVITLDVIPELVARAKENMKSLGLYNVHVYEADGSAGFNPEAFYDRIIISAACPEIPQPLIAQLREGGIIIAPVGTREEQTLIQGVKTKSGLDVNFLGTFRFVPLQGKFGFKEEVRV